MPSAYICTPGLLLNLKAIRIHDCGSPDVLRYEEVPNPAVADDLAIVRLEAIGVNFVDTQVRSGLVKVRLPVIPGQEGSGLITAIGSQANGLEEGDTVAYTGVLGAYAQYAAVPTWRLVRLPHQFDARTAAAVMLQGMTAHYLTHDTCRIKEDDFVLVHAGAGGVGLLLIQMAKHLGAYVIATTSSEEKAPVAREAGADVVIVYPQQDFEAEVKETTNGVGVNVVYDSVGRTTFEKGLKCLAPKGIMVLFGQSSGEVPSFSVGQLAKGSLFLTRPMLIDHTASRAELERRATSVFELVQSGLLRVRVSKTLQLAQAAEAHRLLESRGTTGKLLLVP